MKKLAIAIAVIALIATPAFAADIATKAPAPSPAPVYNWTGWYVGVNAGASFGNVKTDFNGASSTFGTTITSPTPPLITNFSAAIPPFTGSDTAYPSGFMGGGQIGFNWQLSPLWVVGAEADFQGADEKDHSHLTSNFTATVFQTTSPSAGPVSSVSGTTAFDYAAKIEWFGTARLRVGYVWGNGEVMSYVTGGLAYGKVDVAGTSALTVTGFGVNPPTITQAFDHSNVNTGWVVGYGTEGVIDFWGSRNWTWKIEGLYMDLGHLDTTGSGGFSSAAAGPTLTSSLTAGGVTTHSHFTDGILRGGLNYKFY